MLPYLSALTPQIAFTHTVREFIRELLKRFVPGKWIDRVISEGDATFDAKLDAAEIRRETHHETRRKWYNVKHEEPRHAEAQNSKLWQINF